MRIYQESDYQTVSRRAANLISAEIIRKPDCVLGLATGSTPIGTYQQLIDWCQKGDLSFHQVTSVNLDEYKGLSPSHDQSYRYFMNTNLFDHVDILPQATHVPNGMAENAAEECARYDALIHALGGTDLQLLGLGRNGHIGFNEPSASYHKATHVVDLTSSTIDANARFFANIDDVPRQAITMGIGAIMSAKRVLIVVSGADKADAVYNAFCGPITPQVPASILQLHGDVVLVGDHAALAKLPQVGDLA